MNMVLAFEALLGLAVAVSLVFSIWRIAGDVRKIREHCDRVDRLAMQRLGYAPRPAPVSDPRKPARDPLSLNFKKEEKPEPKPGA